MKHKYLFVIAICVSTAATVSAAGKASPSPSSKSSPAPAASASAAEAQSARPVPFHGMVSAVDQSAKTFTIAGKTMSRVFKVTDKTQVTKGGATAAMSDITENEEVAGSYWKNADGSLEAKTVKIGPKTQAKASPSASPKKP